MQKCQSRDRYVDFRLCHRLFPLCYSFSLSNWFFSSRRHRMNHTFCPKWFVFTVYASTDSQLDNNKWISFLMESYALLAFRLIAFSLSCIYFILSIKNRNENMRTSVPTICWKYAPESLFYLIRILRQALPASHRCWARDDRVFCEQKQISPNQKHWSITARGYDRCPY